MCDVTSYVFFRVRRAFYYGKNACSFLALLRGVGSCVAAIGAMHFSGV